MNQYASIVQLADIPQEAVKQLEIRIYRRSKDHVLTIMTAEKQRRVCLGTSRSVLKVWRSIDSVVAYIKTNFGLNVPIDIVFED
jgi:hypothetical protein